MISPFKRCAPLLLLLPAFAFGQTQIGGPPYVDSEAPGGEQLSVTGTDAQVNTRRHGSQFMFSLNPSGADTSGDGRGVYIRATSFGPYAINEAVSLSSYLYHEGSGNLAIAYGTTNQFLNRGTGTVNIATGSFNQARQQDFAGQINLARGSLNAVQNWRSSGTGVVTAFGSHNKIEQAVSGGKIEAGYATYSEISMPSAGTITHGYSGQFIINNLHAGGTINNAVSLRASLVNYGAVGNYAGLQIDAPIGNVPTGSNFAINSTHPGPSHLAGNVGIGITNPASRLTIVGVNDSIAPLITAYSRAGGVSTRRFEVAADGFARVGSLGRGAPSIYTEDFYVGSADNWIINDADDTLVTTLPSASAYSGRELHFTNWQDEAVESSSANVIPLGGGTAGVEILPPADGAWATLVSDGTNWIITQAD